MANLRLSQVRGPEAVEYIKETCKRLDECDEDNMPSLEFRINTGKLLLECCDHDKSCAGKVGMMVIDKCMYARCTDYN